MTSKQVPSGTGLTLMLLPRKKNHDRGEVMPKAKREKNCYVCEEEGWVRMSFMTCCTCSRHYCSKHGDPKMDECTACLESGEET
jgi:hypothetical protein